MTTLNTVLTSKQFTSFISTNRAGQLDGAALFALAQIANKNTQALNKLLNLQMMRLVNGSLSKLGNELKAYVSHFKLETLQWQGDRSRFQYIDAEPTDLDVFSAITFTAWREAQVSDKKAGGGNADKPVTAKALLTSFTKLAANGLSGKPDEMADVLQALEQAKADILKAIAGAQQEDIDVEKVAQLAELKPSSKERAANLSEAI